jgi:GDPmannose 4,6-dehydratase
MKLPKKNNVQEKKRALIVGVAGQDGAYLAKLLLEKNYEVWGTSRDAQLSLFGGLSHLGIFEKINKISMSTIDFRSVLQTIIKVNPDEIYNLSGQSSVGLSFEQPVETTESISLSVLNMLEAIRFHNLNIKFYNAGSGEVYGDTRGEPADENTPFRPRSPYAVAKAAATWQVSVYRDAYGLFACSGILFNHESPIRPVRYVTKKIISTACRIANGSGEKLVLGNIDIQRDWGWAPEYVDAMWRMLDQSVPEDYVIGTGKTNSLRDFIACTFTQLNLKWHDHVEYDQSLIRPSEIMIGSANPAKAKRLLNWKAQFHMSDVIENMVKDELNN